MGWKGKESEKLAVERAGWRRAVLAGAISFIYFFPVLWIVLTAFKTERDILTVPPKFLFTPTFDNFVSVFSRAYFGGQATDTGFDRFFFNSIFISATSVLLATILGTLAAYGFSRHPMRGNDTYLTIILMTRMLPPIILIIPVFILFRIVAKRTLVARSLT